MHKEARDASEPGLTQLSQFDRVCDAYEREWLAGLCPQLEDFLVHVPELDRPNLRRELELIQGDYQIRRRATAETSGVSATVAGDEKDGHNPLRIARFRIEKQLGEGGFGRVFLAHDEQLGRAVALKVPHARLISRRGDAQAYLDEARTVANLDHPGIVPVYDIGSTSECPYYMVSKYVDGVDLATTIKRRRPGYRESAELVATVAEALHFAHLQGVVHRDVKPGNILLGNDGRPYIVDFGLALREENIGQGPKYLGTPAYMSPEQASGGGHRVDARSDIFSLGVVLYELLAGRRPFLGQTQGDLRQQVLELEPPPPREYDKSIPTELERICLKALAKHTDARYPGAQELASDLRQFLAQDRPESQPAASSSVRVASVPRWRRSAQLVGVALAMAVATWLGPRLMGVMFQVESDPRVTELTTLVAGGHGASGLREVSPTPTGAASESAGANVDRPAVEPWPEWPADAPAPATAPFNARHAKQHQQAWADYLGVGIERIVTLPGGETLAMVLIPPGEFLMGSRAEERADFHATARPESEQWVIDLLPSEGPQHRVRITQPFWLGRHEVTFGQFQQFVEHAGYTTQAERDGKGGFALVAGEWVEDPRFVWNGELPFPRSPNHPVLYVSWNDCTAFCHWLSQVQGDAEFGLPTEAEWEYACRAGTTTAWCAGDSAVELREQAWFDLTSHGAVQPVGQLQPNGFGLHDMTGNVWEWCRDWFSPAYYGDSPLDDPTGPATGVFRVQRGGDWVYGSRCCRSAHRNSGGPGDRSISLGFRLAAYLDIGWRGKLVRAGHEDPGTGG